MFPEPASPPPSPVVQRLHTAAAGRRLIIALGAQGPEKGLAPFAEIWCRSPALRDRTLFAACGLVKPAMAAAAQRLRKAGALIIDQPPSDNDLLALYRASDLVWCCYSPSYNQSSGIFGRAIQLGRPTIVRTGSYLSAMQAHVGCGVSVSWDQYDKAASAILSWLDAAPLPSVPSPAPWMMRESIANLNSRLPDGFRASRPNPIQVSVG